MNARAAMLVGSILMSGACRDRGRQASGESASALTAYPRVPGTAPVADRATLREMIHFDVADAALRLDAQRALNSKVVVLRRNKDIHLQIDGHADERGSDAYNLALAWRRAKAVRQYLVRQGIESSRLTVRSYGEWRPLDPRHNEEAWAKNRRTEFRYRRH